MTTRRLLLAGLVTAMAIGAAAVLVDVLGPDDTPDASTAATATSGPSPTPAPAGSVSSGQVVEPGPGQPVATDAEAVVGGAGAVSVVVTFAGWSDEIDAVEVSGFVTGVVEDGGTCRLVLAGSGDEVSDEVVAMADAATTTCGSLSVPRDKLEPGTWRAVLTYESATSSGSSQSFDIEVP